MEKTLEQKVQKVKEWAAKYNQDLVLEVVDGLVAEIKRVEEGQGARAVAAAMKTLSYSEAEALKHVFQEIEGNETLLVASRIADACGITRSVIVNALRKLESAGVIQSRSLGKKGTRIKLLIPGIRQTLIS